ENLYGKTKYLDPVKLANKYAAELKHEKGCDYVICLSNLGYEYSGSTVSDKVLAKSSEDIDLILGGHSHTFLEQPTIVKNKKEKRVLIGQVGFGGVLLGRLDVYFERNKRGKCESCKNIVIKD
ncbi:MAG: bifunctional metallophosphatase/5'-nucleotidase, partial [Bacteroidota bacterium]